MSFYPEIGLFHTEYLLLPRGDKLLCGLICSPQSCHPLRELSEAPITGRPTAQAAVRRDPR
jgi:hypothetical protein